MVCLVAKGAIIYGATTVRRAIACHRSVSTRIRYGVRVSEYSYSCSYCYYYYCYYHDYDDYYYYYDGGDDDDYYYYCLLLY